MNLSSLLNKSLATAVVTAAALGGNAMAATCAAKCAPKQTAAACGACKAGAHKTKAKAKAKAKKAKCGACKAKCGACKAKCGAACAAKK